MSTASSLRSNTSKKTKDLERQKAESDALFLSIGEGAVVTDASGKISRINQVALDILGYNEEELIGKWYPGTIIAEDDLGNKIPNMERPITRVFLLGRPISARVFYRKKDKKRIAIGLNVSPVLVEGVPIGAIEVFRDITKELELDKARDEFISLASHQLRTPASAVKQYAGMLIAGYVGEFTPTQLDMLKRIYDSNERQITIVNDLLRVAHADAGQVHLIKHDTDILRMVDEVLEEQADTFKERGQRVRFDHEGQSIHAHVDADRLRMVVENIVDNASKYTNRGKCINIYVTQKRQRLDISVEDEGVGIEKKDLPKLFRKFSRLSNPLSVAVGGTGLGLYWAKKIIALHGGTIRVVSTPGVGSRFTVSIPTRYEI